MTTSPTSPELTIVKNYNQHEVKILGKYLPELKIEGDERLCATKVYKNDNGAVLIEFNEDTNHTGIRNAFKYKTINVIKVSGAIEHHILLCKQELTRKREYSK